MQELGPHIATSTITAVKDSLNAHEGRFAIVEIEAPDGTVVLHTTGAIYRGDGPAGEYLIGGWVGGDGHVHHFRAALTLPEDCWRIDHHTHGYRLMVSDPGEAVLTIALPEGER